ncbi:hypothetical protein D3C84_1233750 [compost metagenome]
MYCARICSANSEPNQKARATTPLAPKVVHSIGSQSSRYSLASRWMCMAIDFCSVFRRSLPNSKKSSSFTSLTTPSRTAMSPNT